MAYPRDEWMKSVDGSTIRTETQHSSFRKAGRPPAETHPPSGAMQLWILLSPEVHADCIPPPNEPAGMNLVPYEYEVCRHGLEDDAPEVESMLVVSEFVGCTPSLSGALRCNPWNVEDTADHVYRALVMKPEEKRVRHTQHFRYVQVCAIDLRINE